MSFLRGTGFETGDAAEGVLNSTASIVTSPVRTGTYALRANPTTTSQGFCTFQGLLNTGATTALTTNTDRYLRFYFRYATKPASTSEEIAKIRSAAGRGSLDFIIRIDSSGNLLAYKATTLLATGTTALNADTWYMIEAKRLLGTTAAWEVKIDGVSEISGSTLFSASTGASFDLGKITNRNGNTVDFFYDDVMLSDSAYPGAGQCSILLPNAVGNYQTFTRGGADSGSNWGQVDELPHNSDTDYLISDLTSGNAETEGLQASSVPGISGTINCVTAIAVVKRDGATNGACRLRLRSASTDSDTAADYASTSAYVLLAKLYATDPATSAAWTTGGLDAAETGLVEKSAANKTRMTFTALMVDYLPSAAVAPGRIYQVNQAVKRAAYV